MDSLKEALARHLNKIKVGPHKVNEKEKLDMSDRAPMLNELKDDVTMGADPEEELKELLSGDNHEDTPMGGALAPDEHDKVMEAIANLHSSHMGRKPKSLGEHASMAAKTKMAQMKGKKI